MVLKAKHNKSQSHKYPAHLLLLLLAIEVRHQLLLFLLAHQRLASRRTRPFLHQENVNIKYLILSLRY